MTDQQQKPSEQPEKKRQQKPKGRGHGEGSVFERKTGDRNKPWVAQIPLGGGKKQIVGYYGSKSEALAAKNKALQEIEQARRVKKSRQTLRDYLEYWLENVHRLSVRLSTFVQNRALFELHVYPALGHIPLQKLTARDVQQLYSKLQGHLAAGRVKNLHVLLHKALKHAMLQDDLLRENVCERVTLPRQETKERQVLTQAQARMLVQAAKENLLETLLIVAMTTGMRHGELRALRWQDVDMDKKEIHIRYTSGRVPGYGNVQSEPKSKKGRRTIAVHTFVIEVLKKHRLVQLEQRLKVGIAWQDHDLVFPGQTGNYFNRVTLYKNFNRILLKANLPKMRIHDLRHSAATILLAMGVNVRVIQEILGHSSISITLGIYGHVLPGMQEEAMQKWGNVLEENDQ